MSKRHDYILIFLNDGWIDNRFIHEIGKYIFNIIDTLGRAKEGSRIGGAAGSRFIKRNIFLG